MSEKLRVGVLFGGRSGEHAISLLSARSVLQALDAEKYQIVQIGITKEGNWLTGADVIDLLTEGDSQSLSEAVLLPMPGRSRLYTLQERDGEEILNALSGLDVIIPVLHGTYGEDGTMQGLFELADLAYVGAGVLASSVGMDKGVFKDVMVARDIPVVPYRVLLRSVFEEDPERVMDQAESVSGYPLFVKPANMGSSVGVHKCRDRAELPAALEDASRYDRRLLVEKGIEAREIELSVLGNEEPQVSIPGEIRPTAEFYSYEAKYHDQSSELLIPAPLTEEETAYVQRLALRAFKAIDGAGMARVDFLMDRETNQLYLNELNTIPGFTPISMYPKLWKESGLDYPALIDALIDLALERRKDKDRTVWTYERD
ncbi:MAG: D-alanine--D-alanine ligase family protein [Anaerolineales bacterium]